MRKRNIVVLDVDGLLLDMIPVICKLYSKYTGETIDYVELNKRFLSNPEPLLAFRKYFSHSREYANLSPIKGMVEMVKVLAAGDYDIYLVTSALNDEISVSARLSNLKKVFGDVFEDVYCINTQCKSEVIGDIVKGYDKSFFVDDDLSKVLKCAHLVTCSIWFDDELLELDHKDEAPETIKVARNAADVLEIILN